MTTRYQPTGPTVVGGEELPTEDEQLRILNSLRSEFYRLDGVRLDAPAVAQNRIRTQQDDLIRRMETVLGQGTRVDRGRYGPLDFLSDVGTISEGIGAEIVGNAAAAGQRLRGQNSEENLVNSFNVPNPFNFREDFRSFGDLAQERFGDGGNQAIGRVNLPGDRLDFDVTGNRLFAGFGLALDPLNFVGAGAVTRGGSIIGRRFSYADYANILEEAGEGLAAANVRVSRTTAGLSTEYLSRFGIDRRLNIGLGPRGVAVPGTAAARRGFEGFSGGVRRLARDNPLARRILDGEGGLASGRFSQLQLDQARRLRAGEITENDYLEFTRGLAASREIAGRTGRVASEVSARFNKSVPAALRRSYRANSARIIDFLEDPTAVRDAVLRSDGTEVLTDTGIDVKPILDLLGSLGDDLSTRGTTATILGIRGSDLGLPDWAANYRVGYVPRMRDINPDSVSAVLRDRFERSAREREINPGDVISGRPLVDEGELAQLGATGTVSRAQLAEAGVLFGEQLSLLDLLSSYTNSIARNVATTETADNLIRRGLAVPINDAPFNLSPRVAYSTLLEALSRTKAVARRDADEVQVILDWNGHQIEDILDQPQAFLAYLQRARMYWTGSPGPTVNPNRLALPPGSAGALPASRQLALPPATLDSAGRIARRRVGGRFVPNNFVEEGAPAGVRARDAANRESIRFSRDVRAAADSTTTGGRGFADDGGELLPIPEPVAVPASLDEDPIGLLYDEAIRAVDLAMRVENPVDRLNMLVRARDYSLQALVRRLSPDQMTFDDYVTAASSMTKDGDIFMTLFSTGDTLYTELAHRLGISETTGRVPALGEKALVESEFARALDLRTKMRADNRNTASLMRRVSRSWKRWATFSPSYNVRNAYGGTAQEFAAGHTVVDINRGINYVTRWFEADDAGKASLSFIEDPAERAMFREIVERGDAFAMSNTRIVTESAIGEGARFERFNDAVEQGRRRLDSFGTAVGFGAISPTSAARALSENVPVETVLRASHILARMRRGFDYDSALDSMYRYHFDYADLSKLERNISDWVPFYTFAARNIALQTELFFRRPGLLADLARFQRISEERNGSPLTPEWQGDAVTIRASDGRTSFLPDVPFNDLIHRFNDVDEAFRERSFSPMLGVINETSPLFKVLVGWQTGVDPGSGFEIRDRERVDLGQEGPLMEVVAGTLLQMGFAQVEEREGNRGQRVVTIDGRIQYALNNTFPIFQRMNNIADNNGVTDEDRAVEWLNFLFGGFHFRNNRQSAGASFQYTEEAQEILNRARRWGNTTSGD